MIGAKHFINNKYTEWYWAIIKNASVRQKPKRTEQHHVLPKGNYMFPEFASLKLYPWNRSYLTLREHFICHRLLVKMTTGKAKLSCAYGLKRLAGVQPKFSSKQYEIAKIAYSQQRRCTPSPLRGKPGRPWSDEARRSHSIVMKKRMSDPVTKHRCSIAKLGKGHPHTLESRAKIGLAHRKPSPAKSASKLGVKNPAFGTRWYHSGMSARQFLTGHEPNGWILGRKREPLLRRHHTGDQRVGTVPS